MASESREEQSLGPDLPADVSEWLDDQAATLGVDREDLVVQILASYHAAGTTDDGVDPAELVDLDLGDVVDVEAAVDERVEELVAERVEAELDDRIEDALADRAPTVADAVEQRVTDAVADDLDDRITRVDEEFRANLQDVRERVVQVKREVDAKAPTDHTHEERERVDELAATVRDLAATVDELGDDLAAFREEADEQVTDRTGASADLQTRLDDAEEKLTRVAWVVSDLKDETGGRDAHEQAVARIKRAAAQEGVSAATCGSCGESVQVGLLTEPECPHCKATVSDVRPEGGILRKKARLVAAAQLEAGEEPEDT